MNKVSAFKSKKAEAESNEPKKFSCFKSLFFTKVLFAVSIISFLFAIISAIIFGLSIQNKELFQTTTTTTTTTTTSSNSNSTGGLSIGQSCLYSNQCPQYAFCSGTCQCPVHYYFNGTAGACNLRKTNGVTCSSDYECNTIVGLVCSTTCQCDSMHYWNSSYVLGGGLPNGRCQNKKTYGMYCPNYNEGVSGIYYGTFFNSQITRYNKKI